MYTDDEELQKARFYHDSVLRLGEATTKAYERNMTKIQMMLGILSAIIPISTGVGYYILSNTFSLQFFFLFVSCLIFFILATIRGVVLLNPKWFTYKDIKLLVKRYADESLSFMIFKIATNLFDSNEKNVKVVNSLRSGLKQMSILIIVGLILLISAFFLLGIQIYYNIGT
jgi:hypothetical protein